MYFGAGYWGRLFWGPGYWTELGELDCSGGPYVYIGYWEEGYAQCDESESPGAGTGTGGGRMPVRFPQLPSMKPRDRRRRHEEDLLIVIL